jgi:hypothetical protein
VFLSDHTLRHLAAWRSRTPEQLSPGELDQLTA